MMQIGLSLPIEGGNQVLGHDVLCRFQDYSNQGLPAGKSVISSFGGGTQVWRKGLDPALQNAVKRISLRCMGIDGRRLFQALLLRIFIE